MAEELLGLACACYRGTEDVLAESSLEEGIVYQSSAVVVEELEKGRVVAEMDRIEADEAAGWKGALELDWPGNGLRARIRNFAKGQSSFVLQVAAAAAASARGGRAAFGPGLGGSDGGCLRYGCWGCRHGGGGRRAELHGQCCESVGRRGLASLLC